jgi:hypothetical protein
MKVLLPRTYDINGGAARATYRLDQGLQSVGVTSQMLVQNKSSNDEAVVAPKTRVAEGLARPRITIDNLPDKLYPQRSEGRFSSQWLPDRVLPKVVQSNPDIISPSLFSGRCLCSAFNSREPSQHSD